MSFAVTRAFLYAIGPDWAAPETLAAEELREKIASREARMGVIGLGYVGLPLALEFAKAGFRVTGIDVKPYIPVGPARSHAVSSDEHPISLVNINVIGCAVYR